MNNSSKIGKKKRLQRFVDERLLKESAWSNAFAEEVTRLTPDQRAILGEMDPKAQSLVADLMSTAFEYKRALRLALTIADTDNLPETDWQLIHHTFKLAQLEYRAIQKHGSRTAVANSTRTPQSFDFFEPYLDQAYYEHLTQTSKFPGRSKLAYATGRLMKDSGCTKLDIDALSENTVKRFLANKKQARSSGEGLLNSLINPQH